MRKLTEKQKATMKEKKRRERGIAKNRKIAARIVAANGKLARTKRKYTERKKISDVQKRYVWKNMS